MITLKNTKIDTCTTGVLLHHSSEYGGAGHSISSLQPVKNKLNRLTISNCRFVNHRVGIAAGKGRIAIENSEFISCVTNFNVSEQVSGRIWYSIEGPNEDVAGTPILGNEASWPFGDGFQSMLDHPDGYSDNGGFQWGYQPQLQHS